MELIRLILTFNKFLTNSIEKKLNNYVNQFVSKSFGKILEITKNP